MNKQTKIIIILSFISIVILLYIVFTSKIVSIKNEKGSLSNNSPQSKLIKIDPVELKENYLKNMKPAFSDFEGIINDLGITDDQVLASTSLLLDTSSSSQDKLDKMIEEVSELKISIMNFTVPEEFKDFHLDLVMSFNDLRDFIDNQSDEDREKVVRVISEAKSKYNWLK